MERTLRPADGASASTEDARPVDIPTLTGLRAFAALAVVVFHLRPLIYSTVPGGTAAKPVIDAGMVGVDVFFVLSGFIIAHTYAHRLAVSATGAVRDYLIARLARVYPLHLLTFLAMVVLIVAGAGEALDVVRDTELTPTGFVGNLLMLQSLPGVPAWNFPAWSISCEIAAYLVFPLFAARVLRMRWVSALIIAGSLLCLQPFVLQGLSSAPYWAVSWPRIAVEFTVGTLLWVVWHRVLRPGLWGDLVVLSCLGAAVGLLWSGHTWTTTVAPLGAMIPAAACATGPVGRILAHPVAQWGGRVSYALYLVHIPVLTALLAWVLPTLLSAERPTGVALLVLGVVVVAMVAAAALLHHGVEEPTRYRFRATTRKALEIAHNAGNRRNAETPHE